DAWPRPGEPDSPVLLVFPGNGGNLSGRSSTLLDARQWLGVPAMVFDYPGYGKSEGSPNEENCYDAAEGAIGWLRDVQSTLPERVIFYGESLGGGVASEMARRYPCKALVLVRSFTSLPAAAKMHSPRPPAACLMSTRFAPPSKLPQIPSPVVITSATADTVVPYEHGETMFRAANEPKHFFRDDGADHNDPLPDAFWTEL